MVGCAGDCPPRQRSAVTAVLFALEHVYYPVLTPLMLTCGLATGWVRHRTGIIAATIPIHIAVDLAVLRRGGTGVRTRTLA
jgi:membrane protease YdiL (CAAX protease family)